MSEAFDTRATADQATRVLPQSFKSSLDAAPCSLPQSMIQEVSQKTAAGRVALRPKDPQKHKDPAKHVSGIPPCLRL